MVQESMTFLSAVPDIDTKVALINTLVSVSEGKVCVSPLFVVANCVGAHLC